MSILKPRNRLVNFRLTEEEFGYLRDACMAQGARSISDFARSAVLRQADRSGSAGANTSGQPIWDSPSTQSLAELQTMMVQLEAKVGQLVQQVDAAIPLVVEQQVTDQLA
jgi:hypothetical protein